MNIRKKIFGYSNLFWFVLISNVFIFILFSGCSKIKDAELLVEKEKIERVINTSIGWASDKDTALLYSIMAQDTNFFIFHPDSLNTIVGFDNFKKLSDFWMNPKFKAVDHKVKNLRLNISNSGDVAWFSCYLDDNAEWDGKYAGWVNVRWTGVLEKRNGIWVIVQNHFSFPK
jgi:ketosteroid isomerase-like protein